MITQQINQSATPILPREKFVLLFTKCCQMSGITINQLDSSTRKGEVVCARQRSMYFLKQYARMSLANIGDMVGGKDHATVLHSCRTVQGLTETNSKYRSEMVEIENYVLELCSGKEDPIKVPDEFLPEILKTTSLEPQISIKDPETDNTVTQERINKMNAMQRMIDEQYKLISELRTDLDSTIRELNLYKRKAVYAAMPERILEGSHF